MVNKESFFHVFRLYRLSLVTTSRKSDLIIDRRNIIQILFIRY